MWRGFLFLGEQSLLVPPGFAFALTATTKKQKTPVVALLTLLGQGSIPCGVLLFLVCCIGSYVMFKFMNFNKLPPCTLVILVGVGENVCKEY